MSLPDFHESTVIPAAGAAVSSILSSLVTWLIARRKSRDHLLDAIDRQRETDREWNAIQLDKERKARDDADTHRREDRRKCDVELDEIHDKYVKLHRILTDTQILLMKAQSDMQQLRADVELYRASMKPEGLALLDAIAAALNHRVEAIPHSPVPA